MEEGFLLSIIMPVFNAMEYIDRAIESILSQTWTSLELILVDDCSTDGSGERCEEWANRDERVQVFHLEQNSGAGRARNFGIDKASGTYLTFVDADDEIEQRLYKRLFDGCHGFPYDVIVWGLTERYFNGNGEVISENILYLEDKQYQSVEELRRRVIDLENKTLFGYQWNHLYKLDLVKKNNIRFKPCHLYEDYFFNLAYIEHVSSMAISSCTGYYYNKRMNQSLTKQFVAEYFVLSRKRVQSMLEVYERWGLLDEEVYNILGCRYLRYYFSALMRNNDCKANMPHSKKRDWVKKILRDPLFKKIGGRCKTNSLYLKVLQSMMKLHLIEGCLLMGKVLYIVRTKSPQIYAKKGQIH